MISQSKQSTDPLGKSAGLLDIQAVAIPSRFTVERLEPGERVTHVASVHALGGLFGDLTIYSVLVLGLVTCLVTDAQQIITLRQAWIWVPVYAILAILIVGCPLFGMLRTECIITNRQVHLKRAWTATSIPLHEIDSVIVCQGLFGRLFDFGTLEVVRGVIDRSYHRAPAIRHPHVVSAIIEQAANRNVPGPRHP